MGEAQEQNTQHVWVCGCVGVWVWVCAYVHVCVCACVRARPGAIIVPINGKAYSMCVHANATRTTNTTRTTTKSYTYY